MELFDSTKRSLYSILDNVRDGKIQLPDFQRGWIWDDFRIKGLIASIAKSFPIGAVMLLEYGHDAMTFKTRPVESVKLTDPSIKPDELILDGQQRITTLYQVIYSNEVVNTTNEKKQDIQRWYYIDMRKALDENCDLEEAVLSINENKQITKDFGRVIELDLSKTEYEYENLMYPVCMIDEYSDWRSRFNRYWNFSPEKTEFWDRFESKVINNFTRYQIPVIKLTRHNSKEAVCQVFEKVNTGGIALNVFELLTAIFASDSFDLRENWDAIKKEFSKNPVLKDVQSTDFLQAVTLLSTYNIRIKEIAKGTPQDRLPAVSAKRKEILNLTLIEYKKYYSDVMKSYLKTAKFLNSLYIFRSNDLPYNSQLVPLSAFFAYMGDEADNATIKNKLTQWYWCGVFGELYGGANETRYALDFPQLVQFAENKADQNGVKTIYDANFNPARLHTLRSRNSAAYKGVYALVLNTVAKDWIDGSQINFTNYLEEAIDIHHIFPKHWCEKPENGIPLKDFDCIVNKTALSARTNRIIGGEAPTKYLVKIETALNADSSFVSDLIRTHKIEPAYMYKDDFYGFFKDRKNRLLEAIGKAMGKRIEVNIAVQENGNSPDEVDDTDDV